MSKTAYMRGLQNFIQDIRSAQNKEQEQRRVEKELAKIRERFGDDRSLSGYDRRKYVWKLLYIYMLGYDIEFGHKQAADLVPQPKYKDKQVGYMACSLLLRENDEFLRLTMNAIRMDLTSRNEAFETLALSFIGNVGGTEMADALTQDVIKLLSSGTARPLVKKRASLALLRLIRKTASENQVVTADTFSPVINSLLEERDLGLLLSVTTLLQGVCARNGSAGYEGSQPRLIKILERLTMQREREVPPEYLYYGIPSPWLQCKCLRVLQFFPPPEVAAERATLNTILQGIIESVGAGDAAKQANANKANALYGILFEAISLTMQYDTDRALLTTCVTVLGNFLQGKEPNVKYLALETLSRLALVPEILEAIRHHQNTVVQSLKDADVSIRKRSMDLLFTMCDTSCAEELVKEMLAYLVVADFSIREELVLKVAILAEKFAPNVQWYVDVAIELLEKAGDFVSEEVWHRVVQLVTNNPAMQQYAARNVAAVLKRGAAHESLICTAAYILGEFGRLITAEVTPREQFKLLNDLFSAAAQPTKGLLMTAFIKIYLLEPQNQQLRTEVLGLFERYQKFMDAELQQRAVEYLRIASHPQAAAQQYLLPMPKWEERESSLLKRLQQTEGTDADTVTAALGGGATSQSIQQGVSAPPTSDAAAAPTTGPTLVVGGPMNSGPVPQPSLDLLGSGSLSTPAPAAATNGTAAPSGPPKPANAVDLLSDLLGDAMITPAVAPAAAAPPPYAGATGMPPGPPTGAPGGYLPQYNSAPQPPPHFAGVTGAVPPPGAYPGAPQPGFPQQPGYPQPPQPAPGGPYATYTGAPTQAPAPYAGYTGAPGAPTAAPFAGATGAVPPQAAPYAGYTGAPGAPSPVVGPYAGFTGAAPYAGPTGAAPYAGATGAAPPAPYAGYTGGPNPVAPPYAGFTGAPPGAPFAGATGAQLPAYQAQPPQLQQSGSFAGAPVAGPTGGHDGIKPLGSVDQWFNNLLVKDRGILYEDTYLQVGLQARFQRGTGQVVLFLGNKSREGMALTNLQLLVTPPQGLQVNMSPPPTTLAGGQQVQVAISVSALAPFGGAPGLLLEYQLTAPTGSVLVGNRQELRLPVVPHKFMIPEPGISKELFFEQWKTHNAPPARAQEMVDRGIPLTSPSVVATMRLANLGVEHGYLDPSQSNEAGAAYFICGPPGAAEQSVLVMARVEGNPQNMAQFRVTVASPAPALSAHVKTLVATHLKIAA